MTIWQPDDNANTLASYRDAVITAIALRLNSDEPTVREHYWLDHEVRSLLTGDHPYLRAAAGGSSLRRPS